jgi:hypothetical protein
VAYLVSPYEGRGNTLKLATIVSFHSLIGFRALLAFKFGDEVCEAGTASLNGVVITWQWLNAARIEF